MTAPANAHDQDHDTVRIKHHAPFRSRVERFLVNVFQFQVCVHGCCC